MLIINRNFESFKDKEGKRWYYIPAINKFLPSVTTILSLVKSPSLELWKKQIGEENAKRISWNTAQLGKELHDLCEKSFYDPSCSFLNEYMPDVVERFLKFKPLIEPILKEMRSGDIICIEKTLFSYNDEKIYWTNIAGKPDIIGIYKGKVTILDFKTSGSDIDPTTHSGLAKDIEDKYIHQIILYAKMFSERTGVIPEIGIIAISSPYSDRLFTFSISEEKNNSPHSAYGNAFFKEWDYFNFKGNFPNSFDDLIKEG